jgi:RHS repeat-associated protein
LPVYAYLTNGQKLVYDNDVNGNRVRNTISGTSDNFYFNGADGKTEAVSLVAHGSNLIYNILGAGGDNIGQVKVAKKTTKRYHYLKDHLGSIKVTVDASGNAVGWDDYYPYGAQMDLRNRTASADGRYKFTGKERDASTGLDYFGARYYDSWNGRWNQVDPLVNKYPGWSSYNYCLDNSLKSFDPNGKGVWDFIKGMGEAIRVDYTIGYQLKVNANFLDLNGEVKADFGSKTIYSNNLAFNNYEDGQKSSGFDFNTPVFGIGAEESESLHSIATDIQGIYVNQEEKWTITNTSTFHIAGIVDMNRERIESFTQAVPGKIESTVEHTNNVGYSKDFGIGAAAVFGVNVRLCNASREKLHLEKNNNWF